MDLNRVWIRGNNTTTCTKCKGFSADEEQDYYRILLWANKLVFSLFSCASSTWWIYHGGTEWRWNVSTQLVKRVNNKSCIGCCTSHAAPLSLRDACSLKGARVCTLSDPIDAVLDDGFIIITVIGKGVLQMLNGDVIGICRQSTMILKFTHTHGPTIPLLEAPLSWVGGFNWFQ